jgi:hypothetical protein
MQTVEKKPELKKLHSFKFRPSMIKALQEIGESQTPPLSVTALLERGAALVQAQAKKAPVLAATSQPARTARSTEAQVAHSGDACGRCGHAKSFHWSKGCRAGCACGERMYRPPAKG